jgi:hypothetical protein
MDENEQAEATWEGVHIATREDSIHKILLYQINGTESFYVELSYNSVDNLITKFRPFKSMEVLNNLYGRQIDILQLLNN